MQWEFPTILWMHCLRIRILVVAIVPVVCVNAIFLPGVDTTVATVPPFYPNGRDRSHNYKIINDERVYDGPWRRVIRRTVHRSRHHIPTDDDTTTDILQFDILDMPQKNGAVIIFAWNTTSQTATIIREYMPGPHRILSGLAAGIIEDDTTKHPTPLIAAQYELEEECHLTNGTWYRLTSHESISIPMDKYISTEITPYLVINPEHVTNRPPRPLDYEEDIEIVHGVTPAEIVQMIIEGDFNIVGGWAALLALEKLRELGEI